MRISPAGKFWIAYLAAWVLVVVLACRCLAAGHLQRERYYQDLWCVEQGGIAEWRLPDNTRCDCLTATHAVEVDFARKFYEAIGQSLWYSLQTGRRAGVVLILERPADRKYWIRLNSLIDHFYLPIDTWTTGPAAVK